MLKPDGQLVLIDFGIARELTKTYEQKQAEGKVTRVVSDGYSPLEQVNGRAVPQSDFFALGRTCVYLLTGIHPLDLCDQYRHDIYTDELDDWRNKAPQISPVLGDFIDKLMARPIQKRPPDTQTILEQLEEIEQTLYPQRSSASNLSNPLLIINEENISLEYCLGGSWDSPGHSQAVRCVAISPNGQSLVSGSDDKTIKVWDLIDGEEICTFTGHEAAVNAVAISPDGQTIASGSDDETITLWNLNTEEEICTLDGHLDGVNAVAFSRDGKILASAGGDCTIKVWRIR